MRTPWIVGGLLAAALGCDGASSVAAKEGPTPQPAAAAAAPANTCGGKDQPDCPLQNWMKATLQAYQREGNFDRLARGFEDLKTHAPAGYGTWIDISERGAEAARRSDAAGVRAACKSCHDDHRARYRRELRATKWM